MKQRVLVLGASGFIGKHVVRALLASDWATPISARKRAIPAASAEQAAGIQLDATDTAQLRRALEGVTGVVNCVAGSSETIVNGARALFSVAAEMPLRPRIVHLSSIAVYGDRVGDVDEAAPPSTGLSAYGAAKLEAERLAHESGLVVVLRLGIVYGPDSVQWSGRISALLHAHRLGDLGSAGDGYCNLLYVTDAADAIVRALTVPDAAGRTYNLGLPECPTWNEYFARFAIALGAVPVTRISRRRLRIESKIFAPPLKIAEIIGGKFAPFLARRLPPPIPPSLVRLFGQEIRMKVGCAERGLGVHWTPLNEGLSRTVQWYQERVRPIPESGHPR